MHQTLRMRAILILTPNRDKLVCVHLGLLCHHLPLCIYVYFVHAFFYVFLLKFDTETYSKSFLR